MKISESGVLNEAEIGDLILSKTFKSKHIDKIAILIKMTHDTKLKEVKKNELFVLRVGVDLTKPLLLESWNDFKIEC